MKIRNKFRIIGIIMIPFGIGSVALSIFTDIHSLLTGIIVMAIGVAFLWATETAF